MLSRFLKIQQLLAKQTARSVLHESGSSVHAAEWHTVITDPCEAGVRFEKLYKPRILNRKS